MLAGSSISQSDLRDSLRSPRSLLSNNMAVAVRAVPRPLLSQAVRIVRRSATPRALARLSRLSSLYTLTLLSRLRYVLARRIPALVVRQVARITTPVYASKLLRSQVRSNVRRLLSRLLQQLALRAVLGLLPLGLSPLLLSALSALVGSAASNAAAVLASQVVGLLPQDTVTRMLEEIRLHADAVREVIGDEIRRTFQVGSVVEYIQLIEWAQWRLSLERMAGLDGVQEALKEMVARVISAVGESAIMPSPKALLA